MLLDSINTVQALQPAQYSQNIQTIKQAATEKTGTSNKTTSNDNEAAEKPGTAENEAMEAGANPTTSMIGATDAKVLLAQMATGTVRVDNAKTEQSNANDQQTAAKPPVVTTTATGNYQPAQQMMKDQLGAMMGGVDTKA
jgi:hypothetical protein